MNQASRIFYATRFTVAYLFTCVLLAQVTGCNESDSKRSVRPELEIDDVTGVEPDPTESSPGGLVMPDDLGQNDSEATPPSSGDASIEMPDLASSDGQDELNVNGSGEEHKSQLIRYGTWEDIRGAVSKTGKVTVVDLWSLACEPCLKEFPGLVQLHQDLGEQVTCFSVNLDFDGRKTRPPETYESEVTTFLTSVHASGFSSYICTTASDDVFLEAKIPSIPVVMVFDAEGNLVKQFIDGGETAGFTYEKSVRPFVDDFLKK